MREIKFRAWENDKMWHSDIEGWSCWGDCFMNGDNIMMQYTGLKDNNGVEIYEGDIVKYEEYGTDKEYIAEIKWCECSCFYAFMVDKKDGSETVLGGACYIEVIGNIYENPELLEEITC